MTERKSRSAIATVIGTGRVTEIGIDLAVRSGIETVIVTETQAETGIATGIEIGTLDGRDGIGVHRHTDGIGTGIGTVIVEAGIVDGAEAEARIPSSKYAGFQNLRRRVECRCSDGVLWWFGGNPY
jgi:hypothetical protein